MLSETEVARDIYQVEEARPSRRTRAPKELALEQILKNKTSSPCSLPEFMDFLICDEENAEVLQFFTWFCGYVSRFSELSSQEMLLSPPWKPAPRDRRSRNGCTPAVHNHRRGGSDRLEQILEIMDKRNARDALNRVSGQGHKKVNSNPLDFSTPRRLSGTQTSQLQVNQGHSSSLSMAPGDEAEAARCALQPCRREIDQVVQQYIRSDAPRRLKISDEDLIGCLEAVKHTTHPSALMSAFTACETTLKSRSHPAFIRQSQRNSNKPRLIFVRCLAILIILLGFGLSLLFILGPFSRFYRVISLVLWWPSWTIFFASFKGICLFLYLRHLRQLRPWEQYYDIKDLQQNVDDDDDDNDDDFSGPETKTHISSDNKRQKNKSTARGTSPRTSTRASVRSGTHAIVTNYSIAMQTFGGANKWLCKTKWEGWQKRSTTMKIWDDRVRVESRAIRLLQDRTMLLAVCLGGAVSSLLTVGSLWLPGGR